MNVSLLEAAVGRLACPADRLLGIDVGDNDLIYHLNSEEEPEAVLVYIRRRSCENLLMESRLSVLLFETSAAGVSETAFHWLRRINPHQPNRSRATNNLVHKSVRRYQVYLGDVAVVVRDDRVLDVLELSLLCRLAE